MIDTGTEPATAVCDCCGVTEPTVEVRNGRGELTIGCLPAGWRLTEDRPAKHICAECSPHCEPAIGTRSLLKGTA